MRPFLRELAGRESAAAAARSMTVTSRPRTLTTPTTSFGARGTSVTGGSFRISRTSPIGTAYVSRAEPKGQVLDARPARASSARRALRSRSRARARSAIGRLPPPRHRRRARNASSMSAGASSTSADALIAELGRAGEAVHLLQRRAERLDDDVLLADELVDHEPEAARADAAPPTGVRALERAERSRSSKAEELVERGRAGACARAGSSPRGPRRARTRRGSSQIASCTLASGMANVRPRT